MAREPKDPQIRNKKMDKFVLFILVILGSVVVTVILLPAVHPVELKIGSTGVLVGAIMTDQDFDYPKPVFPQGFFHGKLGSGVVGDLKEAPEVWSLRVGKWLYYVMR